MATIIMVATIAIITTAAPVVTPIFRSATHKNIMIIYLVMVHS
jgi:hypothetical protein